MRSTVARAVVSVIFCVDALLVGSSVHAAPAPAAIPAVQQLTQMGHSVWRVKDGLFPAANVIAQTSDGYLWLGTNRGLVRFDGVKFERWNTFPEGTTADWNVSALYAARDGSLWIGTTGQTVAHLQDGRLQRKVIRGLVTQFAEDAAGNVWFTLVRTHGELVPVCRMIGEEMKCLDRSDLTMTDATSMAIASDGTFWVGGSQLCHWQRGEQTQCYLGPALKPLQDLIGLASLVVSRDGKLWVGMPRGGKDLGVGQFEEGRWKPIVVSGLDAESLSVTTMREDRSGAIWVGTEDRGIYRIRDGQADHLDGADGLSSNSVSDVLQDREGTVWVVTSGGLDAFRALPVTAFSMREGLRAERVESVLPMSDGAVWIGNVTPSRLVADRVTPLPYPDILTDGDVTSMLEDHAGRLWIGLNSTLNVLEDGRLRRVHGPEGADTRAIEFMAEDAKHRVWAVTVGPKPELLRFTSPDHVERLGDPRYRGMRSFGPDQVGGMWLGFTDGALAYEHDDQWAPYPSELTSKQPIRQIALGTDELIAMPTVRGLLLQKAGRQWLVDGAHGLPCNRLGGAVFDDLHDLWISANCGILRIAAKDLADWMDKPNGKIATRLFDATDGVQMGDGAFTPHATKAPDGRLWFATGKVALVIDPARIESSSPAPTVRIEKVVADRSDYPARQDVELPVRTRDLEFHYTALNAASPQRVRFRYRLEGHDDAWRDADTRRTAYYNDLAPGSYRLLVSAASPGGTWTEHPAEVAFVIPPAFYQTRWFIALCVAAAMLLAYALYAMRLRSVERGLQDRLLAKNAERERIARELHDTLLQSNQALIWNLQAAAGEMSPDSLARQKLEDTLKRADSVMEEGRDRVLDLRLPSESLAELPEALAAIGSELAKVHPSQFRTIVEGEQRELVGRVKDALHQIGREALVNAFRHAAASTIEVQIVYGDDALSLRIRDDGVGIAADTVAAGFRPGRWGLKGLKERAQEIGAVLQVWSRVDAGTEIDVEVDAAIAYRERSRSRFFRSRRLTQ